MISYCYDIINIAPYEYKTVKFTPKNNYYIFKYNHIIFSNVSSSFYTIRGIKKNNNKDYNFYSYTDEKNITQTNGKFINYEKSGNAKSYIVFINNPSHEYYIVIQYNDSGDLEETFCIFSSDSLYEVKNMFSTDYYIYESTVTQNYIFSISSNQKEYVKFGISKWGVTSECSLQVADNEYNNTIYRNNKEQFEDSFILKENHTYYFNFSLSYTLYNNYFFIYLMKVKYSNLIDVEKNKNEFDNFPVIKEINFLLNSISTPESYKLIFEYNHDWISQSFEAYGYTTDNIEYINNHIITNNQNQNYYSRLVLISNLNNNSNKDSNFKTNGSNDDSSNKTIDIIRLNVTMENCYVDICKGYIVKKDIDFKMVVLKVRKNSKNLQYIKFRYGKEEFYPPETVGATCLFGFILALPNIIMYIVRKCQNKMTATKCTLAMNILLNFTYGNLLGYYIKLGGNDSRALGGYLLYLYIILCLGSFVRRTKGKSSYFDVIYNLSHNLEDVKSLKEVVSYNRKLCPKVKVGCYAQHKESREVWKEYESYTVKIMKTVVYENEKGEKIYRDEFDHYETKERLVATHVSDWGRVDEGGGSFRHKPGSWLNRYEKSTEYRTVETWRKELEYVYTSWQDETQNINNIKYCTIIEASFSPVFFFDQSSQDNLADMKKDLRNEGYTHDTDVKTYDNFTVPNFISLHKCSLNEAEYQKKKDKYSNMKGYLTWTILFLLGYSSLFETYARYEIAKEKIYISKTISSRNDKRAGYFVDEVNQPPITISFVHTKIQNAAIEKKIEKGELSNEDKDIPLIVVK
jgi:hypothetical protein